MCMPLAYVPCCLAHRDDIYAGHIVMIFIVNHIMTMLIIHNIMYFSRRNIVYFLSHGNVIYCLLHCDDGYYSPYYN